MSEQRKSASCEGDTFTPQSAVKRKYQRKMVDLFSNEPGNGRITLEFDDMCTDVIDMILCKMQPEDLVNISDASTRLRKIACSVFSRKYAHRLVLLDVVQHMDSDEAYDLECALSEQKDAIVRTCDVKIWFKLMRNFGSYIKHVRIISYYDCKMNFTLLEKVFDYCSDTLETLGLDGYRMLSVRKPLRKLQEFSFHAKRFESLEALELMPNVRTLKLRSIPMTMAKSYAKLERIELQVENDEEVQTFISFIRLNRQIKHLSLRITFKCRPEQNHLIYSSIADNLGQLTSLKLFVYSLTESYAEYRFKTVESFLLVPNIVIEHPEYMFQFDNLKKLTLGGAIARLPFCTGIALRNKKMKILKLDYMQYLLFEVDANVVRDLVKELPELEQFSVFRINEEIKSTLMNHLGSDWEPFEKETCNFKINRRRRYRFRKIVSKTCA